MVYENKEKKGRYEKLKCQHLGPRTGEWKRDECSGGWRSRREEGKEEKAEVGRRKKGRGGGGGKKEEGKRRRRREEGKGKRRGKGE